MAKQLRNRLFYAIHDSELSRCIARYAKGMLLDIGCGMKPYSEMLAPYITDHIGMDHQDTLHKNPFIDIYCTAYDIPVNSNSFDSVICTSVLEHLEEPEQAIRECYRVLKPGGHAIYSIPFIWHIHEEPRDFYRFSKYGIEYLFHTKVGFDLLELNALCGFWGTFGQLFVYNLYRFNRGPFRWLRIIDALGLLVQGAAYVLDRVDKTEHWTFMYMVVARKPTDVL